jgi:hypothetical protein
MICQGCARPAGGTVPGRGLMAVFNLFAKQDWDGENDGSGYRHT